MRDKLLFTSFFIYFLVGLVCCDAYAYTGSGTSTDPYVVSAESGLREILTELPVKTSWVYIRINNNITLTKNINVSGGKYRISAKGADRTIKRSGSSSVTINGSDPQYCMRLTNGAQLVMGFDATNYTLRMGGNKSYFTSGLRSSGWFNISSGCKLTIGLDGHLTNTVNNENDGYGSVIRCLGDIEVNGEISYCESSNGGAIAVEGGNAIINSTAKIHGCKASTEGGGIFVVDSGQLQMNGGEIYSCSANQEGGGIFIGSRGVGKIYGGKIYLNTATNTGGGIFSGYGSMLYIGKSASEGPNVYSNVAGGSGGGIRCNGGLGNNAGGTTYFYGGIIDNNYCENVGGGIACGPAGSNNVSKLYVKGISVTNNQSKSSGGGIWIPNKCTGTSTEYVVFNDCSFSGNTAGGGGGAITTHGSINSTNTNVTENTSTTSGGGIYIGEAGKFYHKSGTISTNKCNKNGKGIYVLGQFQISNTGQVNSNNDVYLCQNKYIEVLGKVSGNTYLNAAITSAITDNGTKLVKVSYSGADSESELYYTGSSVDEYNDKTIKKRYKCNNISPSQLLRPGKSVEDIGKEWIIISEEYLVSYEKNIDKKVENLPSNQKKYWNENIILSNRDVSLKGYQIVSDKHWNYKADGSGIVAKPGTTFSDNKNTVLYAQWIQVAIQKLFLTTTDRYYVVGQNIALSPKEILKKVIIEDDLKTGNDYPIYITEIVDRDNNIIASGQNIKSSDYINTDYENKYTVKIKAVDDSGDVETTSSLNIYIIFNDFKSNTVRFISKKYLYTLHNKSKWSNSLKNILINSVENISRGENLKIKISNQKIKNMKESIRNNNYIISNNMNKALVEGW